MKTQRDVVPEVIGVILAVLLAAVFWGSVFTADADERPAGNEKKYSVEAFSDELTIRIECSGVCDLGAMKAEAREAVAK